MCVSAVEARKGEERRHDLRMEDRHLFTIMVGEEETLAKFLLHSAGEGTERGGAEGCVTVLYRGKTQERVALWRDTYASSLESSKLSPFFFRMVRREGHTDHKGECVCVWVSAVEARKAEGGRRMLQVRNRHLFAIVVGEEETFAKFLLDSGGEGTERGGAEGCVTVLFRRKAQERVALWRDTYASSLESSKLSPFFSKMVRHEGHTDHKGECVCVGLYCRGEEGRGSAPCNTGERQAPC